jgi:hypothetical protein
LKTSGVGDDLAEFNELAGYYVMHLISAEFLPESLHQNQDRLGLQ